MCKNSKNSAEKSNFVIEMCKQELKKTITGVYGGSFNPIHIGHTSMASRIISLGFVDEMWLVVSPQNPLKDSGLWEDDFRLSLARVAVRDVEGVEVSDVEFGLPRPNYMIVTLETLSANYPDREFVLVIGQDNWDCFNKWYRWEDIQKRYRLLVLPRRSGEQSADIPLVHDNGVSRVTFVETPLVDMSSTWIRSEIERNPSYDGEGLAPEVWDIIKRKMR